MFEDIGVWQLYNIHSTLFVLCHFHCHIISFDNRPSADFAIWKLLALVDVGVFYTLEINLHGKAMDEQI